MSNNDSTTDFDTPNALRHQLLANGFTPLPLVDKGIRIKKWSSVEVTPDWLDQNDKKRFHNTGLRCDQLFAFDIDVTDEALADAVEKYVEQRLGKTPFCRIGRWPKRLLLYRVEGVLPERSGRTAKYGDARHQVELLCTAGRQFAAYGIHPVTQEPYEWEDDHPLECALDDLPAVTTRKAMNCLEGLDKFFLNHGLEEYSPAYQYAAGQDNQLRDLELSTPVEVHGVETTWRELQKELTEQGVFGNLLRENGEFGDSNGVHFFKSNISGECCAHDFPRDCLHLPVLVETSSIQALATILPEPPEEGGDLFEPPVLRELINDWVIMGDRTVRHYHHDMEPINATGFMELYKHEVIVDPNPPAGKKPAMIPITQLWRQHNETKRAHAAAMRPDKPLGLFPEVAGRVTILNTYRPPSLGGEHTAEMGEVDTFLDFMDHLIPDAREREFVLDWIATKIQKPWERLHGLIMVTPTFGTGRGTLTKILGALLGVRYVREVGMSLLSGSQGQAQYNDFLSGALLVSVPESADLDKESSGWRARVEAYEKLKQLCDPGAEHQFIVRKRDSNAYERVFSSLLISSNHLDAVAIPSDDRRFVAVDNTLTPLVEADDLLDCIYDWLARVENLSALNEWLLARETDYDPYAMPMMTPAKQRMVQMQDNDLDWLYQNFVEQAEGDICVFRQWKDFVLAAKSKDGGDLSLPSGERLNVSLRAVLRNKAAHLPDVARMKIEGVSVKPWVLRNLSYWAKNVDKEHVRQHVLLNGQIVGDVVPFRAD